jgi:predicted O-methyltransferase YrrM
VQIRILKGDSRTVVRTFPRQQTFDLVYIDGEHHAASVLEDAVLTFPLLKVGGAMVFDDYGGGEPEVANTLTYPKRGVEVFVRAYRERFEDLLVGWQVHLRKVSDGCNIPDCPCQTGGSH